MSLLEHVSLCLSNWGVAKGDALDRLREVHLQFDANGEYLRTQRKT